MNPLFIIKAYADPSCRTKYSHSYVTSAGNVEGEAPCEHIGRLAFVRRGKDVAWMCYEVTKDAPHYLSNHLTVRQYCVDGHTFSYAVDLLGTSSEKITEFHFNSVSFVNGVIRADLLISYDDEQYLVYPINFKLPAVANIPSAPAVKHDVPALSLSASTSSSESSIDILRSKADPATIITTPTSTPPSDESPRSDSFRSTLADSSADLPLHKSRKNRQGRAALDISRSNITATQ